MMGMKVAMVKASQNGACQSISKAVGHVIDACYRIYVHIEDRGNDDGEVVVCWGGVP